MSEYVAHTETDKETGITLQIIADQDGGSSWEPEEDEAIIFAVLHRNCINPAKDAAKRDNVPNVLDEDGEEVSPDFTTPEGLQAFAAQACGDGKEWEAFPLYRYEHGRSAYSCAPFSCPWDSGQTGFIFVHKDSVGPTTEKAAKQFCETYAHWANGDIWGFVVEDEDGETIDSCWGFIGDSDDSYMMSEARSAFESAIEDAKEAAKVQAQKDREEAERQAMRARREALDVAAVREALESAEDRDPEANGPTLEAFNRLHPETKG